MIRILLSTTTQNIYVFFETQGRTLQSFNRKHCCEEQKRARKNICWQHRSERTKMPTTYFAVLLFFATFSCFCLGNYSYININIWDTLICRMSATERTTRFMFLLFDLSLAFFFLSLHWIILLLKQCHSLWQQRETTRCFEFYHASYWHCM